MNKTFYIKTVIVALSLVISSNVLSQETAEENESKPVRDPFNTNQLIDLQTVVQPSKKAIELIIHHRFGTFENGLSDLFGIYAPSNIRLGVNYGLTNKLMVGLGTEKNNKLQDIHWKWNIMHQTRSGSIPFGVSYYGDIALDARNGDFFGENYQFTNRFSYFHQLIIARKFNPRITLQVAPGYVHFNTVESDREHDIIALSAGGRFKIINNISILAEYDHSIPLKSFEDTSLEPKSNLAFALEIGTSTHAFQITLAQYNNIINQRNFGYNLNDLSNGDWSLGFNITVRLN
ncbi:MAG: hypothetical protein JSV22_06675 [Bacteroidales bacterium]|nr:MAG: hypothetical protein JSV22_06675 [Bacteroidales bacterium]